MHLVIAKRVKKMATTAKKSSSRGLFIVFEGGEGTGKSTQIQRLKAWLESMGHQPLVTREPGGTRIGEQLRSLVVEHRSSELSDRAELLIYEASRAQHVDTVIRPALEKNRFVLCDRFMDSSTVYQGMCKGLGRSNTQWLNRFATAGLKPDIVFVLDLPEQVALERVKSRKTPMTHWDQLGLEFHRQVRKNFQSLARSEPKRFLVVDASKNPEAITQVLVAALQKRFKKRVSG